MALTEQDVLKSLEDSIKASDPSIDTKKGPIRDFTMAPVAPEIAAQSSAAEHVSKLYSTQFSSEASQEEVDALANNFSMQRGGGRTAKIYIYCMRFTRPTDDETITIESGKLVSNKDSSLVYKITLDATMIGANANAYYNSTLGAYEVRVPVEAIAVGANYNLPAYRVNTIVTEIQGIDRIENREDPYEEGLDAEKKEAEVVRIQSKFLGLDKGTYGGVESYVRDYSPEAINDVAVVIPKDRNIFYRTVFGPAMDVYLYETSTKTEIFSYNAVGGETELVFPLSPVLSVVSVIINDTEISTYQLDLDPTLDYKGSTRATDKLVFDTPLLMSDVVIITYTYDKLVQDVQVNLFSETMLFNTDVLVRRPVEKKVVVELDFKMLPSAVESRVQQDITTALTNLVQPNTRLDKLEPEIVRVTLEQQVSGVLSIIMKSFRASDSTIEIETIYFAKNEKSILDMDNLKINTVG